MTDVLAQRGWFETVTGLASVVLSLTILGLAVVLAPAAWSFWRSFKKVRDLLDRVYGDITPITRHAHNIADNLDYITTSIRNDVQQVNATIASANRRLNQAVELTETRMNEFNALLQVVQQEAEQAFVSTAAAVRGVRTGAASLGGLHDDDEEESLDDGDDDESDSRALGAREQRNDGSERRARRDAPAGPRVRSRSRPRE